MPIYRQIKNVVNNYSDVQRKVRDVTSNEHWSASPTLMAEIADKTSNVIAFTEIMEIVWRRLQDRGRKWRHVYKSLLLLEYLIKVGDPKVAIQCRDNIHSLDELRHFSYIDEGRDQGSCVRDLATRVTDLLRNKSLLDRERAKLVPEYHRTLSHARPYDDYRHEHDDYNDNGQFDASHSSSSHRRHGYNASPNPSSPINPELDSDRPVSSDAEEMQLQLALAISKEQHETEQRKRREDEMQDELKLHMVLQQSRKEKDQNNDQAGNNGTLDDLFNLNDTSAPATSDPWGSAASASTNNNSAWAAPCEGLTNDLWGPSSSSASFAPPTASNSDPWGDAAGGQGNLLALVPSSTVNPSNAGASGSLDLTWSAFPPIPSAAPSNSTTLNNNSNGNGAWPNPSTTFSSDNKIGNLLPTGNTGTVAGANGNGESPTSQEQKEDDDKNKVKRRNPSDFLGEHKALVDLDKLIDPKPYSTNPFAIAANSSTGRPGATASTSSNPFIANARVKPSLNQIGTGSQQPAALTYYSQPMQPTAFYPNTQGPWQQSQQPPHFQPSPLQQPSTGSNPFA